MRMHRQTAGEPNYRAYLAVGAVRERRIVRIRRAILLQLQLQLDVQVLDLIDLFTLVRVVQAQLLDLLVLLGVPQSQLVQLAERLK